MTTRRGRNIPSFPAEVSTAVLDEPNPIQTEQSDDTFPVLAETHPDISRLEAISALTGGQDGSVDAQGTFTPETAPEVAPEAAEAIQTPPVTLSDLQAAHSKITTEPNQLPNPSSESPGALRARLAAIPQETLRKIAQEHQGGAVTIPDGSIRIPVTIPAEMVAVIQEWAIGAGQPFEEYLESHVLTCLTSGTLA